MSRTITWAAAILLVLLTAGCTSNSNAARSTPPLTVQTVQVQQRDVPIYGEWLGTLEGMVNADIKAQVSGYIEQQGYSEGSVVTKGQLLFQIDPRPFQAVVDQARAQLAQANGRLSQARAHLLEAEAQVGVAEANQGRSRLDVERYTPLAKQQAITQQDLDNAIQNNLAAKAQVQAAKAQVETAKSQIESAEAEVQAAHAAEETARLNLGFTHLTSPIDGVAGAALQQVGSLVSPAAGTITTVSTLNPIKCYFTVSEQEYLDFHRRYDTPERLAEERRNLELQLILSDGTVFENRGRFYFADREVNVRTGAIRIAGLFDNPNNTLRPGQYAKIRFSARSVTGALLVPQRAVSELQGGYQVAVVGAHNKVQIRPVKVADRVGADWIISEGVQPGEQVVVEGLQRLRNDTVVDPKPYVPARRGEAK
ncbi:efflux RND transporter periplasmic adaptor subunit [Paludibaculum fermentans]|uniref:Efflux RND transporter periplasmic adaptor subunit n=1 Tax=Paludibaculum fermentans TaxID=1473598 RepID=A0A7S7SN45_PALFE|nr:efflux RND transporter periplasmic adaptor subunit [Paludibaculum fermentans]QOY90171.1 efflux RND transporter periplasmic adaptor subunit [Paludibaculum fermentans]